MILVLSLIHIYPLTEFNSNNTQQLTVDESKKKIAALAYIQEELAKMGK